MLTNPSLNVFLDAQAISRVGGKSEKSLLSFEQKFLILLHTSHTFTRLLIKHEHELNLHAFVKALKSIIRNWILRTEVAIRYYLLKCIKFIKLRTDTQTQMMAALQQARIVPGNVFQVVGVDYSSPHEILYRCERIREELSEKLILLGSSVFHKYSILGISDRIIYQRLSSLL